MISGGVVTASQLRMLKAFCEARARFPKRKYTSPEREHIKRASELIFFQAPIEEQDQWVEEMIQKGYFNPFEYGEWMQALEEYIRDYSNHPQTHHPSQKADYSKHTTTHHSKPKNTAFAKQHGLSLGSATKNRQKGGRRAKTIKKRKLSATEANGGSPPSGSNPDGETKNCKLLPTTATADSQKRRKGTNGLGRRGTGAIDRATGAGSGRAKGSKSSPEDGVLKDAKLLPTKQQQERETDAKQSHIK